ncbi:MAG: hypothetical protein JW993_14780 [Sedimentisphaerales bacterium]|nr:hypothetical protein [Sedimentisphaerales bacterium]
MCRRLAYLAFLVLAVTVSNVAQAELFEPPLKNPSFELPDMGPGGTGQWAYNADDWIMNSQGQAYLEDGSWFPAPDGSNVFKLWSGAYLWQQIGTWDANRDYEISMWVGRSDSSSVLEISLWAGGNPGALPSSGFGGIGGTVGATEVASGTLTPTVTVGQNEWMTLTLSTGTDFTAGDALWIRIDGESTSGTATYADNVQVLLPLDPALASRPTPANGATDVRQDAILSWTPGETAARHNVYFGTSFEDVNTAGPGDAPDLLVSQGQQAATYQPTDVLTLGQTYYWRVDEVEAGGAVHRGMIWQFTVEPVGYPVENIIATASDFAAGSEPEKTVDRSGLDDSDQHSDENADMWLTSDEQTGPLWIQYEFDRVYRLEELWIWNANVEYELYLNFGVKDVTIEYAVDANEWTPLGTYTLAKGSGLPTYAHNNTIDFDGVLAKYVRINVDSGSGGARTGLSEVRFFQNPYYAREPQPASGATGIDPDVVLSWRPGRGAATHEVHLSADEQAVVDSAALVGTAVDNSYQPGSLELETTYYWKVNEVDEAGVSMAWGSDIWSFSTPPYLVVDDFESYSGDDGHEIFNTWIDGYNVAGNGSQVGHDNPPYVERTITHAGAQSMPFSYNNTVGVTISEAQLELEVPQDWTASGVQTLVLYFRGVLGNASGQLYLKVNGVRKDYPGSAASLAAPLWKQWNIDVASLGAGAKSVKTVVIGVSGTGTGLLYFDDVRLYRTAPPVAEPAVDPGTANLVAHYTMENDVRDVSGHGYDGTALTGSSFDAGQTGYGRALVLDGMSGYAELPVGTLIQSLSSASFATWVNWSGSGGAYQRVFDFGTGTDVNMWLSPNAGGQVRFGITVTGSGGESRLNRSGSLSTGWHHLAVTIDGTSNEMDMYVDGSLVASNTTNVLPMNLGNTTQNWIGRSQYTGDPYFNGSVDDFRIYNRALTGPEVQYLVGDR